jgi:hypothetical protein
MNNETLGWIISLGLLIGAVVLRSLVESRKERLSRAQQR